MGTYAFLERTFFGKNRKKVGIIIFSAIQAGGFHTVKPFFQTRYGISVTEPANYPVFYTVVGLITLLSFTAGKRAFCHYGCWWLLLW
jgi:polyferredoxin